MINNNIIGIECPSCSDIETWDHVIKYNEIRNLRVQFTKDLSIEMLKEKLLNIDEEEIFSL